MCLAIPGRVAATDGDFVVVDYGKTKRKARNDLVKAKVGDFVLVRGKIVIERVESEEAKERLRVFAEAGRKIKKKRRKAR